ncbi:MAG: hypothetical protein ABR560_02900, partial [Bacteroidales bacterium]
MEEALSFNDVACRRRIAVAFVTTGLLLICQAPDINAQTAVASNSGPICAGDTVRLYETGGDAESWEWSSSGTAVFNVRTLQNPTATGVANGEVFTVRITTDDDDDDDDDKGADDTKDDDEVTATTVVTVFNGVPGRPGQIAGDEEQCANSTGVVFSINPVATATSYLWEVPTGVEITSGQGTVSITVAIGLTAPSDGTIRVYPINACGTGQPRPKNMYVTQLPAAAGPITGSSSFTPGSTGVPYSVDQIALSTSYAWSYSGTGVTITGNGSRSVTLDFTTDATSGQLSARGTNICGEGIASTLDLSSAAKTLTITSVLLEGLYSGDGIMRQAWNATGPQYAAGVADHITVELHDANNYSSVVWALPDVPLSISGTAEINIPVARSGSYYITVRHRNSIETTTAAPVSFAGSTISQSFGAPSAVYGGNLKLSGDGLYLVYGGDVNQDGIVDTGDMNLVDNGSSAILRGYNAADVNGDGIVDTSD